MGRSRYARQQTERKSVQTEHKASLQDLINQKIPGAESLNKTNIDPTKYIRFAVVGIGKDVILNALKSHRRIHPDIIKTVEYEQFKKFGTLIPFTFNDPQFEHIRIYNLPNTKNFFDREFRRTLVGSKNDSCEEFKDFFYELNKILDEFDFLIICEDKCIVEHLYNLQPLRKLFNSSSYQNRIAFVSFSTSEGIHEDQCRVGLLPHFFVDKSRLDSLFDGEEEEASNDLKNLEHFIKSTSSTIFEYRDKQSASNYNSEAPKEVSRNNDLCDSERESRYKSHFDKDKACRDFFSADSSQNGESIDHVTSPSSNVAFQKGQGSVHLSDDERKAMLNVAIKEKNLQPLKNFYDNATLDEEIIKEQHEILKRSIRHKFSDAVFYFADLEQWQDLFRRQASDLESPMQLLLYYMPQTAKGFFDKCLQRGQQKYLSELLDDYPTNPVEPLVAIKNAFQSCTEVIRNRCLNLFCRTGTNVSDDDRAVVWTRSRRNNIYAPNHDGSHIDFV